VIGTTDTAVEYAVWDLLYRLGHRQFFPGTAWEVVPRTTDLTLAVDSREHPAFLSRDIGYGLGTWKERAEAYVQWCARNRVSSGVGAGRRLPAGTASDQILAAPKKESPSPPKSRPEVAANRHPTPAEPNSCTGNPALPRLVAHYAVDTSAGT